MKCVYVYVISSLFDIPLRSRGEIEPILICRVVVSSSIFFYFSYIALLLLFTHTRITCFVQYECHSNMFTWMKAQRERKEKEKKNMNCVHIQKEDNTRWECFSNVNTPEKEITLAMQQQATFVRFRCVGWAFVSKTIFVCSTFSLSLSFRRWHENIPVNGIELPKPYLLHTTHQLWCDDYNHTAQNDGKW